MKIVGTFLAILIVALPALGSRGATDDFCRRWFADLAPGRDAPHYIWSEDSIAATTKPRSSVPLTDNPDLVKEYSFFMERGPYASKVRPSQVEFAAEFPHDANDLSKQQSVFAIGKQQWLVEKYDPNTGLATLVNDEAAFIQGSPRIVARGLSEGNTINSIFQESSPTIGLSGYSYYVDVERSTQQELRVFKWSGSSYDRFKEEQVVPIKLEDALYSSELDRTIADLKVGDVINKKSDGRPVEIRATDELGQGRILTRTPRRLQISYDDLVSSDQLRRLHSPPAAEKKPRSPSLLAKLFGSSDDAKVVPLVGKNGFKLQSQTTAVLDDFTFSKTEVSISEILQDMRLGRYPQGTRIKATIEKTEREVVVGKSKHWEIGSIANLDRLSEYDTSDLYKLKRLEILKPGKKQPLVIEPEYVRSPSGSVKNSFFDVTPALGVERKYSVVTPTGRTEVAVRFPKFWNPLKNLKYQRIADELIANLPISQSDAQGVILIEGGEYYLKDAAGLAYSRGEGDKRVRQISMLANTVGSSVKSRLTTFWHETGHSIAEKLWNSDRVPSIEWERSMALDGRHVSGYSMKNLQEDFAETVAAYIASDGGRRYPELRAAFPARFAFLDRIFAENANEEVMRDIAAEVRRRLGLRATAIAAGGGIAWYFSNSESER